VVGRAAVACAAWDVWRSYPPTSLPRATAWPSAYGGARAVQAICDLCGRAHRPQRDKFADFLGGPAGHGRLVGQGHPAPGAMTADSCGTILAIASFPRRRRASSVRLNRVTLRVRLPRASTPNTSNPRMHWPADGSESAIARANAIAAWTTVVVIGTAVATCNTRQRP
jgi:hypothetical protein